MRPVGDAVQMRAVRRLFEIVLGHDNGLPGRVRNNLPGNRRVDFDVYGIHKRNHGLEYVHAFRVILVGFPDRADAREVRGLLDFVNKHAERRDVGPKKVAADFQQVGTRFFKLGNVVRVEKFIDDRDHAGDFAERDGAYCKRFHILKMVNG